MDHLYQNDMYRQPKKNVKMIRKEWQHNFQKGHTCYKGTKPSFMSSHKQLIVKVNLRREG